MRDSLYELIYTACTRDPEALPEGLYALKPWCELSMVLQYCNFFPLAYTEKVLQYHKISTRSKTVLYLLQCHYVGVSCCFFLCPGLF